MTEREVKRLSRAELLEMLLAQSKEVESLQQQLVAAGEKLYQRELLLETSGSIAEAALRLNGVFEAADAAAAQYLENAARREAEAQEKADRLLTDAQAQCEAKLREAEAQRQALISQANAEAKRILEEARRMTYEKE